MNDTRLNDTFAAVMAGMLLVLPQLHGETGGAAFKDVSVDEQVARVREENAALKLSAPVLEEDVNAACRLNLEFVRQARPAARRRVLAEMFATIPEPALPALADGLAAEVLGRQVAEHGADDVSFEEFAMSAMWSVYARCRRDRSLDNSNQRRIVYAVIAFLKASEGTPEDLQDALIAFVPASVREQAQEEWIPRALGKDGGKPTYAPLIEAGTNDFEVAEIDYENDAHRVTLKFPASEHAGTAVQAKRELENSVLLLAPNFETDDGLVPTEPIPPVRVRNEPSEPAHSKCQCPDPYDNQAR